MPPKEIDEAEHARFLEQRAREIRECKRAIANVKEDLRVLQNRLRWLESSQ